MDPKKGDFSVLGRKREREEKEREKREKKDRKERKEREKRKRKEKGKGRRKSKDRLSKRERERRKRVAHTRTRSAPHNGHHYTEAVYDARWSIRRLSEHRMVPAAVCDAQDPDRST